MRARTLPRLVAGFTVVTLWLTLVAPASAAGGTTRWVDDNAGGNGGPAECATAGFTTIQAAIDASVDSDRVYVCPGTYAEQITIDESVKVRARPLHGATIVPPITGVSGPGGRVLAYLTGDGARLRGFNLDIEAGGAIAPTFAVCEHYDVAIWAVGANQVVRNNYIRATGDGTLGGPCGYDYGIVLGLPESPAVTPSVVAPASARVKFNHVTDFKYGGILIEGSETYAYVRRNTVNFVHDHECVIQAFSLCQVNVAPSVNNAFALTFGIGIESGAEADVTRNWVRSGPDACTQLGNCQAGETQAINWGIALTNLDGTESTDVRYNAVQRAVGGIATSNDADGAVIHHNTVYYSHYSYQIGGDTDEWHHNLAKFGDYGAEVSGSNNNIHDNDFRNQASIDCEDNTSGGTGTAGTHNSWTNNLGITESPPGLCDDGS